MFKSTIRAAFAASRHLQSAAKVPNQPAIERLRFLSTQNHVNVHPTAQPIVISKDELREFMGVWPDIVRDLTEYAKQFDTKISPKHFPKALQYNVPNGKKNRGLALVLAYKMLAPADQLTDENIRLAQILGWCVEMLQSVFILADDIMDGSETRRGHACWYKLDNVGLTAINDSMMIGNGVYHLIHKYFSNTEYYKEVLELFHQISFITTVGQLQDVHTAGADVTTFTMETYKSIVANKTAYYSFYLPVALAMHMAGFKDAEMYRQTRTILMEVGNFFQAQDDFIDCFGDPAVTGKVGTDIQDGKCSWLAVVAMQRANSAQKELMRECYGKSDEVSVQRVKDLYEELMLPHTYDVYEEESYKIITTHIQQISRGLPHKLFFTILDKIYRRKA